MKHGYSEANQPPSKKVCAIQIMQNISKPGHHWSKQPRNTWPNNDHDDSETVGDILAEMGHHEEFHNATFSQDSLEQSFEVPLN